MKLCAAQLRPKPGQIEENIRRHGEMVAEAAASGADLVLFPELSLTGYERELAQSVAMRIDDERLGVLQQLSDAHGLIIGAGLPVITPGRSLIGHLFFPTSYESAVGKRIAGVQRSYSRTGVKT